MTEVQEEKKFGSHVGMKPTTYIDLNAELILPGEDGKIQFDKEKEAARQYHLQHINPNTVFFHNLKEKIHYLIENGYYDGELFDMYEWRFVKKLYTKTYSYKYRFQSFIGALKFYNQYGLKTYDGQRYLERLEDRVAIVALYLAQGDEEMAMRYVDEIISGRMQPATPTFTNAGKAFGGLPISCYLLDVQDNLKSINRVIGDSKELSKMGGGVGINITNIRSDKDPIQNVADAASGVIPFMKELENSFSWINQLGTRPGSGAVYISVHHPNVMNVLDTKRENADEKIRIKTLSIGLVITDILFEAARKGDDIYQFSPYDVQKVYGKPMSEISIKNNYDDMIEDPRIRKYKVNARKLFQVIAELQFESGYPYLMFEDRVNHMNNTPNINRIMMSNLCSEILQPQTPSTFHKNGYFDEVGTDISCNLASLNIHKMMENGENFGDSIDTAVRALTSVSDVSDISQCPTVEKGNNRSHAIGLGAMNLHGFLGFEKIHYGSFESLDFVNMYFSTVLFHAVKASHAIAKERGEAFYGFEGSKFSNGEFFAPFVNARFSIKDEDKGGHDLFIKTKRVKELFDKYNFTPPTRKDWEQLQKDVEKDGIYNRNLIAIAPTGSISMVNGSTMSIHPVAAPIVTRKEGKIGRVYWASPGLTQDNAEYFSTAFDIGSTAVIEVYNTIAPYVDQGASLTLFFKDTATTRDLNRAYKLAWGGSKTFHGRDTEDSESTWNMARRQNLGAVSKTIYYSRISQEAIDGTQVDNINDVLCPSCQV